MNYPSSLTRLVLMLCLCGAATLSLANPEAMPQKTAAPGNAPPMPTMEELMNEAMQNIDLQLMMRIQQTVMNNMELIAPYSQEYMTCLQAEGVFDDYQGGNLKELIRQAQTTGYNCNYILQSLLGQMKFDITPQELERGLSPEYRELLRKSL